MFPLTIKDITTTYNKIKGLAQRSFDKKDYEAAMNHISTAANVAYGFNWRYADEDFEEMLFQISEKIILEKSEYSPVKGRMVFYDVFALDNKGLTQQYIRALMNWDVDLLFIFDGDNLKHSTNIIKELKAYPKAEIFSIESSLSSVSKVQILHKKILDFRPEKAFLHLHPASVVAVTLWNALPQTTRYMINLTDHAFWLGTKCIDFSLEFRDYGYTVSLEKRGLSPKQLLVQPYYPITDCQPFKGFPIELTTNSIIIFTGGAFYKIYGEKGAFFNIMAKLLEQHPQVIILLAGNGDAKPINKFIAKNKFQDRLFLIGNRTDINYVFANCDIYLSTFPLTGGLMGQYAAINSKPILAYTTPDIRCNFAEGFLNWGDTSNFHITNTTIEGLLHEAKVLIENPKNRFIKGEENRRHVISPNEFNKQLRYLVGNNHNLNCNQTEEIDYNKFTNRYLELENCYLPIFKKIIFSRFKLSSFFLFPKVAFKSLFSQTVFKTTIEFISKKYQMVYIHKKLE